MKFDESKIEVICNLFRDGKGIVEISKLTQTYSNNVKKIITEHLGVKPFKSKNTIGDFQLKIQNIFSHIKVLSFKNLNERATFFCEKHSEEFSLFPKSLLKGADCPKCRVDNKAPKYSPPKSPFTKEEQKQNKCLPLDHFLKRSEDKFGKKFSYKNYCGIKHKVTILCPEHGEFQMFAFAHLKSPTGCGKCSKEEAFYTHETFLKKANEVHKKVYQYPNGYKDCRSSIKIICSKHGEFEILPYTHLQGGGCQKCSAFTSRQETYVKDLLSTFNLKVEQHNKKLLKGVEIDVLVDNKIGFEINGLLFHREGLVNMKMNPTNNNKNRHLIKTELASQNGIKLYQIFEDELLLKEEIVKHKILNACGVNQGIKSNGRDCKLSEISFNQSKDFLNKFHIQGGDISKIRIGAHLNGASGDGELVGVMTFKDKGDGNYELNRYATHFNYRVRGLASKMLKWFIRAYNPSKITTFADVRWTPDGENNLYTTLGFKLIEKQPPVYHYYNPKLGTQRFNRMQFQKHKILEKFADKGIPLGDGELSERELMVSLGYDRIWDCGNWKYEMKFP